MFAGRLRLVAIGKDEHSLEISIECREDRLQTVRIHYENAENFALGLAYWQLMLEHSDTLSDYMGED